jgi:RNA-directed DNA polymerase
MRRFILGWKNLCAARQWRTFIVNYADDFVICCKDRAKEALLAMRQMMERLKLTVNEDETHLCQLPQERFDFLGYTIGRYYSRKTGKAHLGTGPAKKSVQRMVEMVRHETRRQVTQQEVEQIVQRLNRKLEGWANYFQLGCISPAYQAIDRYTNRRLRRWLCDKHKVKSRGLILFSDHYLWKELGLIQLTVRMRNLPWAKA